MRIEVNLLKRGVRVSPILILKLEHLGGKLELEPGGAFTHKSRDIHWRDLVKFILPGVIFSPPSYTSTSLPHLPPPPHSHHRDSREILKCHIDTISASWS